MYSCYLCFQLDVVIIDLDGGSVHIPECIPLPTIPEPILGRTMKALHMVSISHNIPLAQEMHFMVSRLLYKGKRLIKANNATRVIHIKV